MYVFILTQSGARTTICSDMQLISLEQLIKFIKEDEQIKAEYQHCHLWEYADKLHLNLDSRRNSLRVGKVDDPNFETRIIKYLTLEEFEEIFEGHIEDIAPLLQYDSIQDGLFRGTILKKYGSKK